MCCLPLIASKHLFVLCMQVVHGGNNDVLWLQRDFHIYMVNVFDTEKACQVTLHSQSGRKWLLSCW